MTIEELTEVIKHLTLRLNYLTNENEELRIKLRELEQKLQEAALGH